MKEFDGPQLLHLSQESRAQWEGLKDHLGKRAKIEGRYGAEMLKLAEEHFGGAENSSGSHKLFDELTNSTLNLGNSHSIFSSQIEKDLLQTMKTFEAGYLAEMKQHEETLQKAQKAGKPNDKEISQLQPLVEKVFSLFANILLALSTYSMEAVGPLMQSEELARKTFEEFSFQQYLLDFLANVPAHPEKMDLKKKARSLGDLSDSVSTYNSRKEKEPGEDKEVPDSPTPKAKKRQSFLGGILKKAEVLHEDKKGKKEVKASKTTEDLPSERPVSYTPPIESSLSADFELDAEGFRVRKKDSAHPFDNVGGFDSDSDEEEMPKPKKLEIIIKENPTGGSHPQENEKDPEAILESLQKLQHGEQKFRMPLQPSASSRKDRRKSGYLLATPDSMSPRTESPLSAQGDAPPFQPSPVPSPSANSAQHDLDDAFGGPVASHTLPPQSPRAQPPTPVQPPPHAQVHAQPGSTMVDFRKSTPAEPVHHRPLRVTLTTLDEAFGGTLTPEPTQPPHPLEEPSPPMDPDAFQGPEEDQPQDLVVIPSTNPFLPPSFQIVQREGSVSLNVHATNPFLPEILASTGDLSLPLGIEAGLLPQDEPSSHLEGDFSAIPQVEITATTDLPEEQPPLSFPSPQPSWDQPPDNQLDVTLSPMPGPGPSFRKSLHSQKSIAEAFGELDQEDPVSAHQTPERRPSPHVAAALQSQFLTAGSKDIDSPVWALDAAKVIVEVREVTEEDFEFDEASSPLNLEKSPEFSFEKVKESQQSPEVPPSVASEARPDEKGDDEGAEREGRHSRFQSFDSSPNEQEEDAPGDDVAPEVPKKSKRAVGDKASKKSSKGSGSKKEKKDKKADTPVAAPPAAAATLAPPISSAPSTLPESSAEEQPNPNLPKSPSKSPTKAKKRSSKQGDALKSTEDLSVSAATTGEQQPAQKSPKKKRLSGGKSGGGEPTEPAESGVIKDFNDILAAAFD